VPLRLTDGTLQQLTFPRPADVPARRAAYATIRLTAASDVGLPVRYFVRVPPRRAYRQRVALYGYSPAQQIGTEGNGGSLAAEP